MKKIVLLAFTLIATIGCTQSKKEENDLRKENLKGSVRSVHKQVYSVVEKFGKIEKQHQRQNQLLVYNQAGNQTEQTVYDKNGSMWQKNIYIYENDKKIKRKQYDKSGNLSITFVL